MRNSLALLGVPLCCTTEEIPAASYRYRGEALEIDLAKTPAIARTGGAVKLVDLGRDLNIIIVHPEKDRFAALDRSCTHGGAQVAYNRHHRTVQCTSWGHSEFALDGKVLGGSAKEPLRTYEVRRSGNRLVILLEAQS
jgi:Rieske Fe-S protein